MLSAPAAKPRKHPSLLRMFVFGSGDIYGGAINVYTFFYANFVTDVIRLDPIYAGVVWLISQIWDAVLDPVMGYLSDMTRSRWGRRRIYFLIGIAPVFISFFIMWFPVQLASTGMKFTYVLVASILFKTVYSMVMVPYQAMKAEFTMDYGQRNRLALMGMIFSSISTAAAFVLPALLIKSMGDTLGAYMLMAAIMGVFFMLPWPAVLASTKGMDTFAPATRGFGEFFRSTVVPFRFKAFRRLAAMFLTTVAALDIISITFVYFIKYYLITNGSFSIEQLAVPIGGALVIQAGVVPLYNYISKRTGKHIAYITGCILWAAGCCVIFLLQPLTSGSSMWQLLPLGVLMGGGISGAMIMSSSMLTDMGEVGELHFKERKEGTFSGIILLLRKGSSALTNFLFLTFIGLAGYIKPLMEQINGKTVEIDQAQPGDVVFVIRIFVALVPAFFVLLGIIAAARYPLGARLHGILSYFLEKQRGGAQFNPEIQKLLDAVIIGGKNGIPYSRAVEKKLIRLLSESTGEAERTLLQRFSGGKEEKW